MIWADVRGRHANPKARAYVGINLILLRFLRLTVCSRIVAADETLLAALSVRSIEYDVVGPLVEIASRIQLLVGRVKGDELVTDVDILVVKAIQVDE